MPKNYIRLTLTFVSRWSNWYVDKKLILCAAGVHNTFPETRGAKKFTATITRHRPLQKAHSRLPWEQTYAITLSEPMGNFLGILGKPTDNSPSFFVGTSRERVPFWSFEEIYLEKRIAQLFPGNIIPYTGGSCTVYATIKVIA